jgi:putative transposase
MKRWVEPHIRDTVVDFVQYWEKRAELKRGLFLHSLGLRRNKFSSWESRYGKDNFHNGKIHRDFWLEDWEKEAIIEYHKNHSQDGYRSVTYQMMDADVVAVSPATVYRVLKSYGFLNKWNASKVSLKGTGFHQPLHPHQHWHVDISYLNICGTFYYFIAVLDGCSRFVIHWDIRESMTERDVELVIQRAREVFPGVTPRIISDNGPQFISRDFKEFIRISGMSHVRTSPYYRRQMGSLKDLIELLSQSAFVPSLQYHWMMQSGS